MRPHTKYRLRRASRLMSGRPPRRSASGHVCTPARLEKRRLATLVNNTYTATPGLYQFAGSTIAGVNLVFSGGPGDQFYIVSSSFITLDNILSFSLAGGVQAKNIFWLANSAFSVTDASPPDIFGTIIAGTTASFANGLVVHGRVFAQTGAVTFGGTPAVVEGLVNACPPLG